MKVFIIGAGIGGLTAALALAKTGVDVEIFEKSPKLAEVGAGIQQSPNAMAVHEALGTDRAIIDTAFEPEAGYLRHHLTGKPLLTTQMKGLYEHRYGHKYVNIHRADLLSALLQQVKALHIPIHLDQWVERVENSNDHVQLRVNGQDLRADALIGADGIRSQIRSLTFGETVPQFTGPEFTGQVAWRGLVPADALPTGTIPFAANNWIGPGRHFVSYYLRGTKLINFVAVEERKKWAEERWDVSADLDELRAAFAGWDPRITELLDACESSFLWGLFDHAPLPKWSEGRITLLGDAAHPMLPFMAQGAAMAIEDGWVLAHSLSLHRDNIPLALQHYESARKPRASQIQKISKQNASLYHQSGLGAGLRNAKLAIGGLLPPIIEARLAKIYGVDVTKTYPIKSSSRVRIPSSPPLAFVAP